MPQEYQHYDSSYTGSQIDDGINWINGRGSYTESAKTQLSNIISGGKILPKVQSTNNNSLTLKVIGVTGANEPLYFNTSVYISGSKIFSGAWNDVAEYRKVKLKDYTKSGTILKENLDGYLTKCDKDMEKGCVVYSDTFGMCVGEEDTESLPVAIAGRVLVDFSGELSKVKAGTPVCSSKNGGVRLMKKIEAIMHPECIIGYISEIPNYKYWNNIEVKDRIWIRVK